MKIEGKSDDDGDYRGGVVVFAENQDGEEACGEKRVRAVLLGIKVWFEAIEGENDEGG